MRKFFILCAALLCLSLTASAEDSTTAVEATTSEAEPAAPALPAPASLIPPDRDSWQINLGFQYQHYNVLGLKFNDYAYQAGVTRYFNNWFGLEGTGIPGFGHAGSNPRIAANSLFLGGGAHLSLFSSSHFEPWAHVLVGWERFRFTESNILGNNSHAAFMAGGGLDYKISGSRLYWRIQGDFFGTNLATGPGQSFSKDYMIGTSIVLNF